MITTIEAIDPVFMFIFGVCLLLLIAITAVMIYFIIRYHRSRAPEPTSQVASNLRLEIIWSVLPTILVLAMFYYGWAGYLALRNVPKGAMDVTATARMWSWSFAYANGKTSPKLYVEVGKPVKVQLVSLDVIHGFYLPAFRVKRDVVPGMKNYAWFVATKPGSYDLFCSAYCGTGHSSMITTVEALPDAEFSAWLKQGSGEEKPSGLDLLEKYGCLGCHSLDGEPRLGPSFKGIWGRRVVVLTNGKARSLIVDEEYLKSAILEPQVDVVEGFQPIMPPNQLTDNEVMSMVEYLKEVK